MQTTLDPASKQKRFLQTSGSLAVGKSAGAPVYKKSGSITGVDLGAKAVKLVSTRWRKAKCEVTRAHCLPWNSADYSDVNEVGAKLSAWLDEYADPQAREIALSLPADLVDHESVELPPDVDVDLDNRGALSSLARKVLTDLLEASAGDAIFDGWVSSCGGVNHLNLTWANRTYVSGLWQQLAKNGWYCRSIEAAPAPLIRAASRRSESELEQLIIDLSGNDATFIWAKAGVPLYSRRRIPMGALLPSELVASGLNIRPAEAEVLLESTGIRIDEPSANSLANKLTDCLGGYLETLAYEIQRTVQYIARLQSGKSLEEVVLCGGVSCVRGLPEWLSQTVVLQVRLANVATSWQWNSGVPYTPQLATAVALANPEGRL